MPWRSGVQRIGYAPGLTQAQEDMLEDVVLVQGIGEGIQALYQRLRAEHGDLAPTRKAIGNWLKRQPGYQIAHMPKKDVSVAPVLPRSDAPLHLTFADTMLMPHTSHNGGPGVGWKVFRAIVVIVDGLTKFTTLKGTILGVDGRPASGQARDAMIRFIAEARRESQIADLHPRRIITDKGSEFLGQFETWRAQEETNNPPFYQSFKTVGTRSSYNSIAERTIQTIRRLFHSRYRAVKLDWDLRNVPARRRRFDWMDHVGDSWILVG